MKIYMNKPKDNWLSPYTIVEKIVFWRDIDYDEPLVKNIITYLGLGYFCNYLYEFRKFVNRDIKYVKIDPWDVWSMDHTLSPIILPMLKELKRVKHGAPFVDDEDVPPRLKSTTDTKYKGIASHEIHRIHEGVDNKYFKRFDYVLDEMIWTFEQLSSEDHEGQFYSKGKNDRYKIAHAALKKHNLRINNGLRLFGKYYRALWD